MMHRPEGAPAWIEAGPKDATATLVFLHGIGGGKKGFQSSVDYFASLEYRALAWDMPGYGDSLALESLTFKNLAQSLEKMLDVAQVNKAVLVGHSMGGMVALQAWSQCPERIAGLVIAASSPAFGQQDGDFQQQFVAQRLAPLNAGKTMTQVADKLIPTMVAPNALPVGATLAQYPEGLALAHACMSAVPPATYRASLLALVKFEQRSALPTISVPTLCLAGEHDKTAPPEVLRRMAQKISGAEYECLAGLGHLMGFEKEAPFHEAVLKFVRRHF
jgi:pimeloyl-ACP methyl ester carboxylesterase